MVGSVKPLLALKKRALSKAQLSRSSNRVGAAGEAAAARYLQNLGYRIIATNISWGREELDIVAFDPNHQELVFVEVKTRRTDRFGHPTAAVNRRKQQAWIRVAHQYLKHNSNRWDFRFDVITVLPSGIEHWQSITW